MSSFAGLARLYFTRNLGSVITYIKLCGSLTLKLYLSRYRFAELELSKPHGITVLNIFLPRQLCNFEERPVRKLLL